MGGGSWLVVSLAVGTTLVSAVAVRVAFFGFRLLGVLFLDVLRLDVRRLDLSGPSLQLSDCRGVLRLQARDRFARIGDDLGQLRVEGRRVLGAVFVGTFSDSLVDVAVRLCRDLGKCGRGLGVQSRRFGPRAPSSARSADVSPTRRSTSIVMQTGRYGSSLASPCPSFATAPFQLPRRQ